MIRKAMATAVIISSLLAGSAAEAKKSIVAVFNIEFRRVRMAGPVGDALRDFIETKLAASGVYEVVPSDQLKRALSKQKTKSYKDCYQDSCQIKIGQELAADRTLSTRVTRIGRVCMVSIKLYHLKRMTAEKGATATGSCTEQGIMASIKTVVGKLATGGGGSSERKEAAPVTGQPPSKPAVTAPLVKVVGGAVGKVGVIWMPIQGGFFSMGSSARSKDAMPVHRVTVQSFSILKTEVTTAQYRACVKAGTCRPPQWATRGSKYNLRTGTNKHYRGFSGANQPVVGVSWKDARKFCHWAGGRLPSEAEWEYAARSGGQARKYPWGDAAATCSRAVMDHGGKGCGRKRTWPVCSKIAGNTAQGLCDMAGNVWEWTEDCWHKSYRGAPTDGSAWTKDCSSSNRTGRSGSWANPTNGLRAAFRNRGTPRDRHHGLGFRCAR